MASIIFAGDNNAAQCVSNAMQQWLIRAHAKISWILMQQRGQKKAAEEAACFPVYHKRAPALAEPFHSLPVSRPVVRKLGLAGIESDSQKEVSGGSAPEQVKLVAAAQGRMRRLHPAPGSVTSKVGRQTVLLRFAQVRYWRCFLLLARIVHG